MLQTRGGKQSSPLCILPPASQRALCRIALMAGSGADRTSDRRRRVRRCVVHIAVFLLLGAVVNVAVAWGIAISAGPDGEANRRLRELASRTEVWKSKQPNLSSAELDWLDSIGFEATPDSNSFQYSVRSISDRSLGRDQTGYFELFQARRGVQYLPAGRVLPSVVYSEFGWPVRCTSDTLTLVETASGGRPRLWNHENGLIVHDGSDRYAIPLEILGLGFALNTAFFAVILWLLFAAPFTLRRWRRVRNGLCPKCAYPIGERDVCTECGCAVRRSA